MNLVQSLTFTVLICASVAGVAEIDGEVTDRAKRLLVADTYPAFSYGMTQALIAKGYTEDDAHSAVAKAVFRFVDCFVDEFERDDSNISVGFIVWMSDADTFKRTNSLMIDNFSSDENALHRAKHERFYDLCRDTVKSELHVEIPK